MEARNDRMISGERVGDATGAVLGAIFLSLACAYGANAQGSGVSVTAKRRELRDIERQLEKKKQEIQEYERQSEMLKRDLSALAGEQSAWRGRIRDFEQLISEAERKKFHLKAKIGALELAENRWQGVLAREFNGYLREGLLQFDYFGTDDLWEQPFRRAAILEKADFIRGLSGSKMTAEKAAAQASQQRARLQTKTAEALAENVQRESLLRQKQEAYAQTEERFERTQKDLQELEDSAAALTQLVRHLERRSIGSRAAPAVLAEPPHSLPWPADGRVVEPFGRQYVAELRTWVIHHGIRLSTAPDAPVHPVQAGKVIFAGPFRSYGKVIIVDHGGAFYTIYGKLGQTLKKPGDLVLVTDVLGTALNTGSEGTLYFEMRQSADALDPLVWLRRRIR